MSEPPLGKLSKVERQSLLQIEKRISSLHALLSTDQNSRNYADQRKVLSNKQLLNARFHGILQKCGFIEHILRRMISAEQETVRKVLHFNEQALRKIKAEVKINKGTGRNHIESLLQISSQYIGNLPFVCLKVSEQYSRQTQAEQQCLQLRKQNLALKSRLSECQKNLCLLQNQLFELFRHMKIQQHEDFKQSKLMRRICDQVFSEQYMIQANFHIRNQYHNLKINNTKLQSQLSKYQSMVEKLKQKHKTEKSHLIQIIRELENAQIMPTLMRKNKQEVCHQTQRHKTSGDYLSVLSARNQAKSPSTERMKLNSNENLGKQSPRASQRTTLSYWNNCAIPEETSISDRCHKQTRPSLINQENQWIINRDLRLVSKDARHKKFFSQTKLPQVESKADNEINGCSKLLQETTVNQFSQFQNPKINEKVHYSQKRRQPVD